MLSNSPRSILLISPEFPPAIGGIGTYAREVAKAYARLGVGVTIVTSCDGARGFALRGAIRVYNVGLGSQLTTFFRMVRRTALLVVTNDYDFLHAITWRVALVAVLLGQGAITLLSVHGTELFALTASLRALRNLCLRSVGAVVAVSRPTLDRLRAAVRFPLPHPGVAWNGVSFQHAAQAHTPAPDLTKIFCLCRLVQRKNITGAVAAIALLKDAALPIKFVIAGDGPDRSHIESEVSRLGVKAVVSLVGSISDDEAIRYYGECGIFLHPQIATSHGNDIEGFGISVADAMSFGCITIAGISGGPADFIRDGDTGFLVDGRRLPDIAEAVRQAITHTDASRKMSIRAQQFALTTLTWDGHVRRLLTHMSTVPRRPPR